VDKGGGKGGEKNKGVGDQLPSSRVKGKEKKKEGDAVLQNHGRMPDFKRTKG